MTEQETIIGLLLALSRRGGNQHACAQNLVDVLDLETMGIEVAPAAPRPGSQALEVPVPGIAKDAQEIGVAANAADVLRRARVFAVDATGADTSDDRA